MKRVIPFAVCLVCFAISMGSCAALADNSVYAIVNNPNAADRLNVRTAPSLDAESLGKYYNGTKVQVLEDMGNGWVQVQIGNGGVIKGYMMKQYLAYGTEPTVTPAMPTYRSLSSGWELYDSQSVNGNYTMHGYGETVALMGFTPEWWHIQVGEKTGFVQAGLFSGDVLYSGDVSQSSEWNGPSGYHTTEMTQGIYATIDARNADRVHLRTEPSTNSASRGLYFTGTEVFCQSNPTQEWTRVVIGSQEGYMKSEYLRWGDDRRNVWPKQPLGIVQTKSWVNVRSGPSTDDQINGKLYKDDVVTILGETASHWYYAVCDGCIGYIKADYVRLSQGGTAIGGSAVTQPVPPQTVPWQPDPSQSVPPLNVTETIDPGDSLEAYITASNCSVTLIPTDSDAVTCQYNANAIAFTNEIARGTQMLTFESRGQTTSSAAVMLYIPRNVYYQIYLDVNNGEGSVAGGFACYRIVNGNNARFSLTLAAEELYGYSIGLTNSECIVGISEVAQNYSIMVDRIANSTIGAAYDMPAYQTGAASYSHTKGNGGVQIKATGIRNSNLEFVYVR